jgi:hypothetical protein
VEDTVAAIAARDPRRAVSRRASVIVVNAIFSPPPDVADHVIKPEFIRRERADRRGLPVIPLAAAAIAVGVVVADVVAPRIRRGGSCACRILVFGLGQQPIGLGR